MSVPLVRRLFERCFGPSHDHIRDHIEPYVYACRMGQIRKITANIPADILANAQRTTGKGVTLTLIEGLKALDRKARLSALRQLRGKVGFDLDLDRTRR
jgi:hypothetical protein